MENRKQRNAALRSPHRAPATVASEFISIAEFVTNYYTGDVTAVMFVPGFRALGHELHPIVRGRNGVIIPRISLIALEEQVYQQRWARLPKQLAYGRWLTLFALPLHHVDCAPTANLFSPW